jgi:hypothetical protein
MVPSRFLILSLAMLSLASGPAVAVDPAARSLDLESCRSYDPETGEPRIDPQRFFHLLVDRYHRLQSYQDWTSVRHVIEREGEAPQCVETRIGCEITDGRLHVETPGSQLRRQSGLHVPFRSSPPIDLLDEQYQLWLAPHMALRFTDEPDREFRTGVDQGFTATSAQEVEVDEKPMVRLELTSSECEDPTADDAGEACDSQFYLDVDPESLLIERVRGRQRLPDGAKLETELDIEPRTYRDAPPEVEDAAAGTSRDPSVEAGASTQGAGGDAARETNDPPPAEQRGAEPPSHSSTSSSPPPATGTAQIL